MQYKSIAVMQASQLAERTAKDNFYQKKIEEIITDLIENENNSEKKIKQWANYEKDRIDLKTSPIERYDQIAAHIVKTVAERGIKAMSKSWIYETVPSECKGEREDARTLFGGVDIPSQSTNGLTNYNNSTPVGELSAAELQEEVEKLKPHLDQLSEAKRREQERLNELLERASKEKIALTIPTKPESKSTPKPESAETDLSDELELLAQDILAVREKVIEFPPETQDGKTWASGLRDFRMIFKGFIDEKYSKSIPEWFRVQITNQQSGKHAAAVKHATMLPGGIKRNLTREQVGDSAEFILDAAWKALNSFDGLAGLISWHSKYMEPFVAERKVNLSPDLSEKA